jgi:soluble lytic murein transglycosylase-like protein
MLRSIAVAGALALVVSPAFAWSDFKDVGVYTLVSQEAARAGVPSHIAHSVIRNESGYRPHLRGAAGEWGSGRSSARPRVAWAAPI